MEYKAFEFKCLVSIEREKEREREYFELLNPLDARC